MSCCQTAEDGDDPDFEEMQEPADEVDSDPDDLANADDDEAAGMGHYVTNCASCQHIRAGGCRGAAPARFHNPELAQANPELECQLPSASSGLARPGVLDSRPEP